MNNKRSVVILSPPPDLKFEFEVTYPNVSRDLVVKVYCNLAVVKVYHNLAAYHYFLRRKVPNIGSYNAGSICIVKLVNRLGMAYCK